PLDLLIEAALVSGDMDGAKGILNLWIESLERGDASDDVSSSGALHPFSAIDGEPSLRADHLDIGPSNFVSTTDGGVCYIDAEWEASGPVSLQIAVIRALWY